MRWLTGWVPDTRHALGVLPRWLHRLVMTVAAAEPSASQGPSWAEPEVQRLGAPLDRASSPCGTSLMAMGPLTALEAAGVALALAGELADLHDSGRCHGAVSPAVVQAEDGIPVLLPPDDGEGLAFRSDRAAEDVGGLGEVIDVLVALAAADDHGSVAMGTLAVLAEQAGAADGADRPSAANVAAAIVQRVPRARLPDPEWWESSSTRLPLDQRGPQSSIGELTSNAATGEGAGDGQDALHEAADGEGPFDTGTGGESGPHYPDPHLLLALRASIGEQERNRGSRWPKRRQRNSGSARRHLFLPLSAAMAGLVLTVALVLGFGVPGSRDRLGRRSVPDRPAAAQPKTTAASKPDSAPAPAAPSTAAAAPSTAPAAAPAAAAPAASSATSPSPAVSHGSQPSEGNPPTEPGRECGAVEGPKADVDGDGCQEALVVEGAQVKAGSVRFTMGGSGASVVVGDWDGDGTATAAVAWEGWVTVYDRWAGPGETLTGRVVAPVPAGVVLATRPGQDRRTVLVATAPGSPEQVLPSAP